MVTYVVKLFMVDVMTDLVNALYFDKDNHLYEAYRVDLVLLVKAPYWLPHICDQMLDCYYLVH